MTSKQDIVEATKKNICGKVTRKLVNGSIEVYPIYNYGAVEIGLHKFHNHEENYESDQPALIFGVYFSRHISRNLCASA